MKNLLDTVLAADSHPNFFPVQYHSYKKPLEAIRHVINTNLIACFRDLLVPLKQVVLDRSKQNDIFVRTCFAISLRGTPLFSLILVTSVDKTRSLCLLSMATVTANTKGEKEPCST